MKYLYLFLQRSQTVIQNTHFIHKFCCLWHHVMNNLHSLLYRNWSVNFYRITPFHFGKARLFPLHVTVCGKPCDRLRQKPRQTRWVILSVIQKCPEMKKWQKVSTLQRPQKPWSWILKLLLSAIICEPDKLESQWRYPRMRKTGLSDGLKKCLIIWKFREKRLFLRFLANFRHLPTISVTNTC